MDTPDRLSRKHALFKLFTSNVGALKEIQLQIKEEHWKDISDIFNDPVLPTKVRAIAKECLIHLAEESLTEFKARIEPGKRGKMKDLCQLLRLDVRISKRLSIFPKFLYLSIGYLRHKRPSVSDCRLKVEIIKTLTTLKIWFPNIMSEFIQKILRAVLESVNVEAKNHLPFLQEMPKDRHEELEKRNPKKLGFEKQTNCNQQDMANLLTSLQAFINSTIHISAVKIELIKSSEALFNCLIILTQLTEKQILNWMKNPNYFVEDDEEEELLSSSVRISAKDLLKTVFSTCPKLPVGSLISAFHKQMIKSEAMKMANEENWWKLTESSLLVTKFAHQFMSEADGCQQVFHIQELLEKGIQSENAPDLLIGQAIRLASQIGLWTKELLVQVLKACETTNQWIRMLGTRWLLKKLRETKVNFNEAKLRLERQKILEDQEELIDGICSATQSSDSNELRGLLVIFQATEEFSQETLQSLLETAETVICQSADYVTICLCQEVIYCILKTRYISVSRSVRTSLLMLSTSLLNEHNLKIRLWLKNVTLAIINHLVNLSLEAEDGPDDENIIEMILATTPSLMVKILNSNDESLQKKRSFHGYQNEEEERCLDMLLALAKKKIKYWKKTWKGLRCLNGALFKLVDSQETARRLKLRDDDKVILEYALSKEYVKWQQKKFGESKVNPSLYELMRTIACSQRKLLDFIRKFRDQHDPSDLDRDPAGIVPMQWHLEDHLNIYLNKYLLSALMAAVNPCLARWYFNWHDDLHMVDLIESTTPRVGIALIDDKGEHILLVRGFRSRFWTVPKGKIDLEKLAQMESDEDVEHEDIEHEEVKHEESELEKLERKTAVSELREETGLTLSRKNRAMMRDSRATKPIGNHDFTLFCLIGVFNVGCETLPQLNSEIEATR